MKYIKFFFIIFITFPSSIKADLNQELSLELKKGDKLNTKDPIGKIATDPLNGQTILSFSIFNNGVPQNPRLWIYKM